MQWIEMSILTTYAAQDAISNILYDEQIKGVVIEKVTDEMANSENDLRLKAYVSEADLTEEKLKSIEQSIKRLKKYNINIGSGLLTTTKISNDWETAWESYYEPIKISDRLMIVPTWEKDIVRDKEGLTIELDPGLAFGTGSHATTALSLLALEKYVEQNDTVIDVGCGSGILSIAAKLLGAQKVIAIDQDRLAVSSARTNAALNDLEKDIIIKQSDLLKQVTETADLIVANILTEVILTFIDDAYKQLKYGGLFITSGIITRKKEEILTALKDNKFQILDIWQRENWLCIIAEKS